MLLEKYKKVLGKSKDSQSLYDHTMQCVDVILRVAQLIGEKPGPRLDRLVFSGVIHDIGKLDPAFQAMISAAAEKRPLPSQKVKHEACTFDHDHIHLVETNKEAIRDALKQGIQIGRTATFSYDMNLDNLDERSMEHIWTFAATHHGLFYVSYEQSGEDGLVQPRIRRQWTCASAQEVKRITLVDLLIEYHPLGGLVMIGDLIASYCHEQGKTYAEVFEGATSLKALIDQLTDYAPAIEASINRYDPRTYAIRDLLYLLAGGLE